MKKCIITINLLFYITFFHQLNGVESNPTTPNGTESSSTATNPTPETTPKVAPSTGTGNKGTPVTLDIQNTQTTSEFDYTDQNGVVTYKVKSGHVFDKIVDGTKDVWESKDNICGTLVRTKTSKNVKYLAILLTNNMFTLFHEEAGKPWKDITSDRHDVTKLKFLGEGDAELTSSDYTVSIVDLSFTYIFNDGVNCKKIKLADADVWNYTDDPKFSEIKLFSLGLASNNFFVKNQSNELKKIEKSDLDLKSTQPTSESLHSDQKGVATLTPKEGDGISGVIRSSGQERDTWTAIWQIQCEFDVQKTISFEDFGKGRQVLTLNTRSGKKMLHRPKEGEPWKEVVDQHQNAFETVETLKSLKQDSSDVTETEVSIEDDTEEQDPSDVTETKESTHTKETEQKDPKKDPGKQLTLVELDLIQNTGSDQFDYVKKNEFSSYEAKHGFLFNKVIRSAPSAFSKEEVFWESKDSEKYVKMVRLKLSDNHIVLILNNAEFILFHKESEDKDWKDITDQRNNFSGFKFFTFDQNGSEYKELDSSGYTMGFNEFSYGVSFNVECHQIKHNDKLIYNYESEDDFGLLKGVYLGLSSNKFFLTNLEEDNKRLDLDKEVTPPKPKPKSTGETADLVIQELPEKESKTEIPSAKLTSAKLTSLDINATDNTPEYQFSDNGIYKTFTALHGNGFNKIMNPKTFGADDVIWQTSGNDYAIKVRLKEVSTGEKYLLLLFVSKRYKFFYSGKKNSPFKDITYTKHSFNDIKLFSKNETTNAYEQLDPSSYNLSLYHLSLGYRAKEGVKFHLVKFGGDVVYNYKDDVNFGDLRAAYLDLIENNLYVMNMNDQTKVVKELSRLKATIIDLNKSESTDQFQCTKDGNLVTYTSIGNTLFDKLIRSSRLGSDEIIWKVIDNIYAKKILVDGQGKKGKITNTILHLENGDVKHLRYSDGKWIQVSNKVSIDITKSQSSNEFDYSVDGEFKTFNAKSSFLFNSLVEPDTPGSETVIWKTTNPSEYVNKLVLKESGNKKYLAMLRVDNRFMLFLKNPSSQNWQDISNTRLNLSDLKMFYFDNDTTGYLLFKDDQYSVSLEKFLYGYEFDGETKCHLVKFRDSVIWNHGDDQKLVSLKSVLLNLLNNKITVSTPDGKSNEINIPGIIPPSDIEVESIEEFEEDEDSSTTDSTQISSGLSEQSESSSTTKITILPATLVELDLNNMESSDNYEYLKTNDNHVFTVKAGFGFSKIKKADHVLKVCPSPNYYCKVVANYGQHDKIILYVYKTDKDFDLLLLDDPDTSTRDITSLPSDTVQALQASKVVSEQLKLLASDDDGQSKELDDNKLMIEELTHLINYKFPENTKCSEIKYNEKTVWKYDKSKHGRYYPTNMLLNTNTSFILLESQNHYQYYYTYINDEWRCISGYKTQDLQPLYPDKLRIFTLNQFGLICVDDTTQFNKSVKGPITSFALNPGSKCVHVKYDDLPVWSYNYEDHEDKYPTLVTVNIDEKTVMVDSSGTYRYLFSYSAGQFRCVFAFKSRLIDPIDPEKIKFSTTDTSGTYVELDKSKYDVEQPDTEYKFTSDSKCTCIKYTDVEIWKHTDDPKFSEIRKFRIGLISNTFYVINNESKLKQLEFKSTPVTVTEAEDECETPDSETPETDVTQPDTEPEAQDTPVTCSIKVALDINATESTNEFDYSFDNNFHTFTPKPNYLFTKVSQGTTDIWESTNNVYGTLVKSKSMDCVKYLAILLTDNTFKVFHLLRGECYDMTSTIYDNMFTLFHKESGEWEDITSEKHDVSKLKFLGENDAEITKSDYKVTLVHLSYEYIFNSGVRCKKIKLGDDEVWKHTDDPKFADIKSFSLSLISNSFFVFNNESESKKVEYTPTEVKTPNKINLDISRTQSISEFEYSDENGVVTYKVKSGHVFDKIVDGTKDVWESKDDVCSKLVRIKTSKGIKYLAILLTDNMFSLFQLDGSDWKDITKDRYDVSKLKLFGENDTELTSSDYKVTINFLSYEFTFNSGVNCRKITLGDVEVWKHESQHGDKYPTSVSFNNLNRNYLVVESSRSYRNMFQFENNQFKSLGVDEKLNHDHNSTGVFDPAKLKFMTTDPDSNQLVELPLSQYTVESPSFITYKFNDSVKCNEIGYDNQPVWKYDENEHSDDFPTTVSINLKKSYVIVDSSHFYRYVYSYYDKKWKELPFGYKTSNISFDKFKLLTIDATDQNKLVELDSSQYEMECSQNVLAIKFNTNVKCTCIMYDKKDVWRYKQDEHKDKYPTTTVFNKKKSTVLVDSGYHYRYLYIYQNKEWKALPYGYTLRLRFSKTQLFDTTKLQVFTMDRNKTLVLMPTNEYDVDDTQTLVSYVFRYSKNCYCVKYDQKDVWEYKQDEHGDNYPRISLNKMTNIMLIESGHYYRYMFQFENGEWKLLPFSYRFNPKTDLVDPDKFKLLALDSDEKLVELDSSRYKREDTNNVVNFKIQYGVKCTCIKYDDKDVWKYNRGEHEYKYPTKISLNKNKKFFLVESGYDYRYLYQLENGEWKLLPFGNKLKTTQSYAFDWSKFKLLSINLSNKPFELDYSNYDRVPNGNILTYTLNPDVNCTEVKYDNTTVWNYNYDDHENNYPTTIIFNRNNGFLIVESKDHYESYYSYYDNKWHSVYGYKASKITKNKEFYKLKLYETNEDGLLEPITGFHEEVTGPVITCNIYYGVKCTHVKYDEKTAWVYDSQKHLDYYPTSVVFNITNGTIKVECQDQYVYFSTFINEEWKPFSGFRNKLTDARHEVKLFQKAKSGKYAFINPSKYNVNWDGENDVYEYDLNNLNCALIKHNENTVWSQTSDEHPKSITYNSDQSKFVLRFDDQYIFCSFEDNQWKKMSRMYGTQSTKKSEQDTPTEDSTEPEPTTPKEPEPTPVTTPTEPTTQTSVISPPSTTPSTVTKPEPTKVALNIEKKEITYQYEYFKNDDIHTFTPKDNHVFSKVSQGTRDIWESTNNLCGTEVMFIDGNDKYLAILLTNNMFTLYKEADKDLISETLDVKKLKFLGENDTVITNSDYELTIVDYAYGYVFNDSVYCRMIKYSDLDVWKHTDDPEFSSLKSLRLDLHKNRFYVTNSSDKTKQVAIKIALDIKQSEDTTQYNFKHSARASYTTLTPKSGHVFNKLTYGPTVIWESKDDVNATLVRIKLKEDNIYLAVLLTNNMFTLFHQKIDYTKYVAILFDDNMFKLSKECGGTWKDITNDRFDITNLKFLGENDAQLSKTDYTVSIAVLSYEFKFKDGVNCKKITYSDDDVWKHTDDSNFADIKSLRLGLATNKFFVKNQSDETKELDFKPTQAKATPVTSGKSETPTTSITTPTQ